MAIGPAEERLTRLKDNAKAIIDDLQLKTSIVKDYVRTLDEFSQAFDEISESLGMTGTTATVLRNMAREEAVRARHNAETVERIIGRLGEGEDSIEQARRSYHQLPEAILSEGEQAFLVAGGTLVGGPVGGLTGIALVEFRKNQLQQIREEAAESVVATFDTTNTASAVKLTRIKKAIDMPPESVGVKPHEPGIDDRFLIVKPPVRIPGGNDRGTSAPNDPSPPGASLPDPGFDDRGNLQPDPRRQGPEIDDRANLQPDPRWQGPEIDDRANLRPDDPAPDGGGSGGGPSIDGDGGTLPTVPGSTGTDGGSSAGYGSSGSGLRGGGLSGLGIAGASGIAGGTTGAAGAAGAMGIGASGTDSRTGLGGGRATPSTGTGAGTGKGGATMMPGGGAAGGTGEEKQERKKTYHVPKIEPSRTWSEKKPLPPKPIRPATAEPEPLTPEHLEATRRYEATRALKTVYRTAVEPADQPTDET